MDPLGMSWNQSRFYHLLQFTVVCMTIWHVVVLQLVCVRVRVLVEQVEKERQQ